MKYNETNINTKTIPVFNELNYVQLSNPCLKYRDEIFLRADILNLTVYQHYGIKLYLMAERIQFVAIVTHGKFVSLKTEP